MWRIGIFTVWAETVPATPELRVNEKEVMSLTRYILIPQRQGNTQRVTLPMEMLKEKKWLKTDCYVMIDEGKEEVRLKRYLYSDTLGALLKTT